MDVPLHLRLAYARRFSDPYGDPQRAFLNTNLSAECGSGLRHGPSWLTTLVQHLDRNTQPDKVVASPDEEDSVKRPAAPPFSLPQTQSERSPSPVEAAATPHVSTPPPLTAEEVCQPLPTATAVAALVDGRDGGASPRFPKPENTAKEAAVQADVMGDAAVDERHCREQDRRAGVHEELLADVTLSLQRRLQQCVLKTLALDDANQQLICAFQLEPTAAVDTSTSAQARLTVPEKSSNTGVRTSFDAVVANRSDAALPEEAKKELAMHLYALRRQVVDMRRQLDAHETAHACQVNAFHAAARENADAPSSRPPVQVEVVKAYAEEPVPYRKGPWRPANFSASTTQANKGGQALKREDSDADDAYSSDAFTSDTGSSEVSTDPSSDGDAGYRSCVNSGRH